MSYALHNDSQYLGVFGSKVEALRYARRIGLAAPRCNDFGYPSGLVLVDGWFITPCVTIGDKDPAHQPPDLVIN